MTSKRAVLTIFDFKDYKSFVRHKVDAQSGPRSGQRSALAAAMSCQLAYLSKVLNHSTGAELSLEQAEAAAHFFSLNKVELSYFIALVSEARAGTESLKEYWREQAKQIHSESRQLVSRIHFDQPLNESEMAAYYSEWYYSAIHMCVGIRGFQTPEKIAGYFKLDLTTVQKTLNFLLTAKLVKKVQARYELSHRKIHLKKDSPYVGKHHLNWKLQAMNNLGQPHSSDLHYTSVVTLSKDDFEKIRLLFFEAIEKARSTVAESEEQILACYALDFFKFNSRTI
ncbi:MAG TPA: TIGR02147 family protein [Bdellovibrio sp.]|nr:TIGR02147 family protein [Bdellovibrio sp.]